MRICRFGDNRLGVYDPADDTVADVSAALKLLPAQRYPLPGYDLLMANLSKVRAEAKRLLPRAKKTPLSRVRLLAPVANPGKIIVAPLNYADHVSEAQNDPALSHGRFKDPEIAKLGMELKAGSALVGPSEGVRLRRPLVGMENRNDHEIELVAVIGRRGTHIKRDDALKYVGGYCIGLDMTLRGPQFPGFRKSIDTYAVLGPWLVTADEFGSPAAVDLRLSVNEEERQKSNTRYLIYDIPRLIEFASSFYTMNPGDLIYTGTPGGVGPVKPGDRIVSEIQGIGRMVVLVRDA
jgi:2-keto-4-pentenoate hydratase/2-oxohepta-3-ene-1,7-dioic acid hydratase in catechol pathway